ncbi:hypothetical protein PsYK624_068070 [Phanerochaete sordida]|uniref:BTB domain-containing protein n=1 Tax=Phanerochaete sordida TaxID=48140 RepID=A0A9P3G7D6_9APHY|nr:hypothetical protein PsYK624_068070 [Phanerochaete sordida]
MSTTSSVEPPERSLASSPEPRPPFPNTPFADIILRSSDGEEYRLCKATLAQASSVFADMFSLPQPDDASGVADEQKDGLPVLPLSEPAHQLDVLLRFCIPQMPPTLDDLATTVSVLEGARKYQIEWALDTARAALVRLADEEPLRVYAIACRYDLKDEAREATRRCLRVPMTSLIGAKVEELEGINAETFQRLLAYRQACASTVVDHISSASWAWINTGGWVWYHRCCGYSDDWVSRLNLAGTTVSCRKWWDDYMKDVVEKLRDCTWEGALSSCDAMAFFLRGNSCEGCRAVVAEHISQCRQTMKAEIVAAISSCSYIFVSDLQ